MPEVSIKPKYTIGDRLKRLPGSFRSNSYKLCIYVEISERTLQNWINMASDSASSIPSDQLFLVADFLECTPIELLNR